MSTMAYPGWTVFRGKIAKLLAQVSETGIIGDLERFSFRYINIIDATQGESQLSLIDAQIKLMGRDPLEEGFHLRSELIYAGFKTIIQIAPNAIADSGERRAQGLLIDVDTIKMDPPRDLLAAPLETLSAAHETLKGVFFALLSKETLERLQPEW
jgi:uncharacterized protein (TIGR04255 family)